MSGKVHAPIQPPSNVGFIGLGQMGVRMANSIARSGYRVHGWTRSNVRPSDHEILFEFESDLHAAVADAKAVIVCVADDRAAESVLFETGIVNTLAPGTIVIDMGTSGPETAKSHEERLRNFGVFYLDAPVSGGVQGAQNASLSIFVGGDRDTFVRARELLASMGRAHHLGGPGAGQSTKLANQIVVAVTIAAVAEGLSYAEKEGIDGEKFVKAIAGGFADSRVLQLHGPRMVARDYSAAGQIRLHLKDLRLADQSGDGLAVFEHASLAKRGFEKLSMSGLGGLDHSAYAVNYQSPALKAKSE